MSVRLGIVNDTSSCLDTECCVAYSLSDACPIIGIGCHVNCHDDGTKSCSFVSGRCIQSIDQVSSEKKTKKKI